MKLTRIEQVEKLVGKTAGPRDLKVIDHLDEHAIRWLSHANFGFVACGQGDGFLLTLTGGDPGFASAKDPSHLLVPLSALDDDTGCAPGLPFSTLFLVSGMEETLRVNGKIASLEGDVATVAVEECYLHCAKSFRRSEFWLPDAIAESGSDTPAFIEGARFLALASVNNQGQADISPKGDPEKLLVQQDGEAICFADRPGNKRIDSFRNIMEQPAVKMIALIPGCSDVLEVSGHAEIHSDESLSSRFTVQGKTPKLVTKVIPTSVQQRTSEAISRAGLWPANSTPEGLVASEIFKAHVQKSKERGLQAKVARAAASLPGAMEKGLEMDYKKNMY